MTKPAKNTICLWYDRDAEEAARFYAKTFPDSPSARSISRRETFRTGRKGMC
jgi:predicted 3-demethylubiquinone-9 3-methyltransferase (glyoxalase superfamily)